MFRQWRLETIALHGDPALGPVANAQSAPIHQTAAFAFESTEQAAGRFALEEEGPIYSRIGNPTVDAFERRMAALEGGIGALAASSGQAAAFYAVANLAKAGDNLVASSSLYGGIYSLLKNVLGGFGIETRFVPVGDLGAWKAAADEKTVCFYAEMVANPLLSVPDLSSIAGLAHERGIPFLVDNTVPTAHLCHPFKFGADVVVYSATKYIGGHGTTIGGAVVDGGSFDWSASRFSQFTEPDTVYHGLRLAEKFGELAYLVRMRGHLLRDVGACMAPATAWQLLQGIETLPVRMERHCDNAEQLADWLERHEVVERVIYPGRCPECDPSRKYLKRGGGMIGLFVKGGMEAARRVAERTVLFTHAANLGDCKSLIIHPASTTHSPLPPEVRRGVGIADNFLRLSVGLEHIEDLKEDLGKALAA